MRSSCQLLQPLAAVCIAFVVLGLSLALTGCREAPSPSADDRQSDASLSRSGQLPTPAADQFVGSEACAACHAKEVQDFHGHPMSRSLVKAGQETPLEDYTHTEFSPRPGQTYYAEKTPDGIIHHEKQVDAAGELIYDQAVPIAYTVGSGARGRSFLINDDGRLFVSAISWYSDPGKWDLSPGYRARSHPRFERQASEGCLTCHVGRAVPRVNEPNRFASVPFLEESIGCERCHGPGKAHLAYRSQSVVTDQADPIVNPAKLHGAERDAVCNQCHLQGRARVVRHGRTEFDFSPGMKLSDVWISFVKTEGVGSGAAAAVSQVEQMYASQCYQQSQEKLSCITCHDGHDIRRGEEIDLGYREKCLKCHAAGRGTECSEPLTTRLETSAVDSCVVCHMPKFPARDVHAAQTEHRILRKPKTETAEKLERNGRDVVPLLFAEPGVELPDVDLNRARGIYLSAYADSPHQSREAVDLLIAAIKASPDDIEVRYALGAALKRIGQPELAVQAWSQVVEQCPAHEDALEALALHFHSVSDFPNAKRSFERLITVNPYPARYYGRLANVLGQLNQIPQGIAAAEKCLERNPSLRQTHEWLVEAYRRTGNTEKMNAHAAILKRFNSVSKLSAD